MRNRFIQYAGLFVGALLAWCRLGSAATGAGALDLRPAIRPGGLPADSCGHGSKLSHEEHAAEIQPITPGADCEPAALPAVEFDRVGSEQIANHSDFVPDHLLAVLERLDSGPPR